MESNTRSNHTTEKAWETELDSVRQYLLSHDHPFPPNHVGVIAALNGIDIEMKRRLRDSKLQHKFMIKTSSSSVDGAINSNATSSMGGDCDYCEIDAVKIDTTQTALSPQQQVYSNLNGGNMITSSEMTDDWQDVTEDDVMATNAITTTLNGTESEHTSNAIAAREDEMAKITKYVVSTLSAHNVVCTSPISALAVVLHIVLLQYCNFICTGIPEDDSTGSGRDGGFAPPIRDLLVGQLLPSNWEENVSSTGKIQFRYRKTGYGTFLLSVCNEDAPEPTICIALVSNNDSNSDLNNPLRILVSDHINLLSWETAKKSTQSMRIPPALHYKALSIFLRTFMEYVQLYTTKNLETIAQPNDHFASHYINAGAIKDFPIPTAYKLKSSSSDNPAPFTHQPFKPDVLTDTDPKFNRSQIGRLHGQFDGDLYPSTGSISASFPNGGMSGNLMGPNHPIFNSRNGNDSEGDLGHGGNMYGGPFSIDFHGMKPRFDPFGPPGGPTEPQPSTSKTRIPGGTGNPNNDLAVPPPFGGNDMFL